MSGFTLECGKYLPGDGWLSLLEVLIADLDKIGVAYDVAQIKEKFGTLRFYAEITETTSDTKAAEFWKRIEKAETLSAITCEVCGSPGELRGGSWMRTLCDVCHFTKPGSPQNS